VWSAPGQINSHSRSWLSRSVPLVFPPRGLAHFCLLLDLHSALRILAAHIPAQSVLSCRSAARDSQFSHCLLSAARRNFCQSSIAVTRSGSVWPRIFPFDSSLRCQERATPPWIFPLSYSFPLPICWPVSLSSFLAPVLFSLLLDFLQGAPSSLLIWIQRPYHQFLSSCFASVAIQNPICRSDFVVHNFVRMLVGGSRSCS
jgi:hypothetical protein